MTKTPLEILKESALKNGNPEWRENCYPGTTKEVIEAIEAYHSQFEGECECLWIYTERNAYHGETIIDNYTFSLYTNCPFCGRKIKRT